MPAVSPRSAPETVPSPLASTSSVGVYRSIIGTGPALNVKIDSPRVALHE